MSRVQKQIAELCQHAGVPVPPAAEDALTPIEALILAVGYISEKLTAEIVKLRNEVEKLRSESGL